MIDINNVLDQLVKKSSGYVSEMDFQFALGYKLKEQYPQYSVYMGYRAQGIFYDKAMHIDIVLMNNTEFIPIELKYKTKSKKVETALETYHFKHHKAYPDNCQKYIDDVNRITALQKYKNFTVGYAIFLTNDEKYPEIFKNDFVGKKNIAISSLENRNWESLDNGLYYLINKIKKLEG